MAEHQGKTLRHQSKLEEFGLKLRRLRDAKGLSQQELADIAEVAKPTVQRIEKGTTSARLDILYSLAEALGVKLSELL
ncbi:helix-turn-helix domain-containing protein [Hymenobacter latericus]|uniref:helix-turn-helix domain-containing protein n=1 Tax=Hymenobacter sp. YIM 151858-1 TaxID=2987688 RepID=UPI002226B16B|nr:helix-turn-helix transcriptional regulator [Hymenobacter sp. YIM 151858-1]UYZ58446.1 helix-turn-helix domain-containing protein [Hymenobacter sp. YIM 151858-1]